MRRDVDGDVDTSPDVRIQGAADECAVHTDVDEAACSTTGSDRVRHSDGQINCNPIAPPVFHARIIAAAARAVPRRSHPQSVRILLLALSGVAGVQETQT